MDYRIPIIPEEHAVWSDTKMGKAGIFRSERIMVGLNAFEPGQEHAIHTHGDMDKVYHVLHGEGVYVLEDAEVAISAGQMLIAPAGVPHGIRNTGSGRLLLLAVLAPAPS